VSLETLPENRENTCGILVHTLLKSILFYMLLIMLLLCHCM